MRIHILSDLHQEFAPYVPDPVDADVVVLAGDIDLGVRGVRWARAEFRDLPVIYVLGNHEYYGEAYPKLLDQMRSECAGSNVHLLENETLVIGDMTFLGATLWTDFNLFGYREREMLEAERVMADYRKIRISPEYRRLHAADTAKMHARSVQWLDRTLAELRGSRTVVVTHHAPGRDSLDNRYLADHSSAAFVSDLRDLVEQSGALLWIHGHVHQAFDYRYGGTRVLSNPRGYPGENVGGFDSALVVEL